MASADAAPATSCFPGHLLLPRPLLDDATERHAAPGSLSLSPDPFPLLCSLPLTSERAHRRRSLLPWPQPLPHLAVAPRGSASTPSSSPPSHEVPDALQRRHHRRFRRRPPKIAAVDSPPPPPPRDHRAAHRPRCELLFHSPSSPRSFPHSSRPSHRSRLLLAAGHGAAVARVTPACARACYQVRRPPRSPQRPSVSPLVHRSAVFDLGRTSAAT